MDSLVAGVPLGGLAQFQQHGQELYRRGDYDKAVEVFTQALKSDDADVLGILDNRSATYCKQGNFELALRDAKQMIKRERHDERGYLRAAKALLLNKKPEKALDMYAYGLKTLPKDHPRRSILQQLHDKLQDKMASSKFRDPFDVLPLEIAVMVLRHFNFKQIVAILRVSKKWSQFLSSIRELWLHMDFSRARSTVSMPAIRSYIRRSRGLLTHATIDHVIPSAMDKVLELLSRCPDLTYLKVAGRYDGDKLYNLFKASKMLKALIISSDIPVTRSCMMKFLDHLPNLERLEVHQSHQSPDDDHLSSGKLPNLKALALTTPEDDFAVGSQELRLPCYDGFQDYKKLRVERLPSLEELSLRCGAEDVHCGYFVSLESLYHPNLRKLSLSYLELFGLMLLPPKLEYLSIQSCKLHDAADDQVRSFLQLSNLTTLVLDDFSWVTPSRLASLLRPDKSVLRVLEVKNCFKISGLDIARLASETRALKGVQTLTLEGMYQLDDATVNQLLESIPELRILNIPYTAVTGVTIKNVVDMRAAEKGRRQKKRAEDASPQSLSSDDPQPDNDQKPLIEILNLKGCENVSLDAIEFGRKQGLTIIR